MAIEYSLHLHTFDTEKNPEPSGNRMASLKCKSNFYLNSIDSFCSFFSLTIGFKTKTRSQCQTGTQSVMYTFSVRLDT